MERFWKYKLDHALFWAITVGFHVYTRLSVVEQAGFGHFMLEIFIRNTLLAIVIYVHLDYLIPLFAQQRKLISYLLGLVGCFTFYVIAKNIHDVYLDRVMAIEGGSFWSHSFYNFSIALFYMAFSLAIQLSKEWFFQREKLRLMEIEKLNTELEYLKLQINPHFLFNSLNTIYFQIEKTNGLARETLLKFSDLLRYPLYECNGKEVELKSELAYIQNYFDLQRLRKDENYQVSLKCDITDANQMVAPLLLVPFVENAFKHISHFPDRSNTIKVEISREHNLLKFYVINTTEQSGQPAEGRGGIGLKNVRRRLDLIYGESYLLDIRQTGKEFEVNLILPLHDAELPDR